MALFHTFWGVFFWTRESALRWYTLCSQVLTKCHSFVTAMVLAESRDPSEVSPFTKSVTRTQSSESDGVLSLVVSIPLISCR